MGTYGMRGNKKGAAEFEAHSCLTTGIKHDTCLKKEKRIERNTRLSAVQWGNHSTEGSWVITGASFEKPTLSLEKPGRL